MELPTLYVHRALATDMTNGTSAAPTPPFVPGGGPTFREYWAVIIRRWRVIVAPVVAALMLTALAVFLTTPMYTAYSTILIERQTPQVLDIRQLGTEEPEEADQDNFYGTQYKILESRSLAAQVIYNEGLQTNPLFSTKKNDRSETRINNPLANQPSEDPDSDADHTGIAQASESRVEPDAIDEYLDNLEIRPELATRLVTVSFTTPDPKLSSRIVNAHVQAYIARGTELRSEASAGAERFLAKKVAELKERVEHSESALNSYRRQRGIVAEFSEDKTKVAMDRLAELDKAMIEAETERIALDAQVSLLRAHDYKSLPAVVNEPLIQNLEQALAAVEAEYASLASEYKPDYPPLMDLDAKRHKLQGRLDDAMRRVANGVELSDKAAAAREDKLREEIDEEKKRTLALNEASVQDAILAREVDTNRELYKNVLERMNEMGMAAASSASNVSVVDYAQSPRRASSPKKPRAFMFAAIVAFILGLGCAFTLERLDDSFKKPEEVEYSLGVPSLGLVFDFTQLNRANQRPSRYLWSRPADKTASPDGIPSSDLVDGFGAFSSVSEAYRAIRIGILLSQAEAPPKAILITSGSPKEGKTVTAINTASAFAQMGEKVLLIDADLRRPRCHQVLQVTKGAGLTEILTGNRTIEDVVCSTGIDRLSLIGAGSLPPNPGELLGSKKMAALISDLKQRYDCVLIDSAPLIPVTDSLLLANKVDGVVLVAGPRTSREDLRTICSRLFQLRAKILGVVLNRFPVTGQYYKHYYNYYSAPDFPAAEQRASRDSPDVLPSATTRRLHVG